MTLRQDWFYLVGRYAFVIALLTPVFLSEYYSFFILLIVLGFMYVAESDYEVCLSYRKTDGSAKWCLKGK